MRRGIIAVVSALVVLGPASAAWARGGGWLPVELDPYDTVVCGANMHFEFTGDAWYRIVTIGGREVVQATGNADATITNVDNRRTITQNISGPTFSPTEVPAEYSARGHNLIQLDANQ